MNRRHSLMLALALGLSAPLAAGAAPSIDGARAAAGLWLKHLDEGDLDTTWAQAASTFRQAVTAAQWAEAARRARGPLGTVSQRREIRAQPTRTLPGAPEGEYVLMQFEATFERRDKVIETLTLALDTDGQWRVAGYFVR